MATLDVQKVIKRVRLRLGLSQEGLARRLNATKGAVQHWERGRNQPDLAHLYLLRGLCSANERKEVDALIRQFMGKAAGALQGRLAGGRMRKVSLEAGSPMLERENARLRQQIAKLQSTLDRRTEQLRVLEDVAGALQREVAALKAGEPLWSSCVAPWILAVRLMTTTGVRGNLLSRSARRLRVGTAPQALCCHRSQWFSANGSINLSGRVKAKSRFRALTTTYCRPSSSKVSGELPMRPPR
jgi:transcriptional regulator with XRE-family HTH domain